MKIRYIDPTRLFWVYMIILNSNKGNLHDYSEFTIIRNCRVPKNLRQKNMIIVCNHQIIPFLKGI